MEHRNEKDIEYRKDGSGPKYIFRGPNIDWGVILLKPGERLDGHYHERVEETFFFLEGEADIVVNGVTLRAVPGDAIRMEPGDTHAIVNNSIVKTKMVFMKYPFDPEDKVTADR